MIQLTEIQQCFATNGEATAWTYEESIGVLAERLRVIRLLEVVINKMHQGGEPTAWLDELRRDVLAGKSPCVS